MYIYIYLIAIFQYSIIYNNYSNTTGIESIQLTSFSSHRACRRAQWPWRNSHFPRQAKLAPGSKLGRYLNAWIDQVSWRCNWQDGSNALTNGTSKDRLWEKKMNTWNMDIIFKSAHGVSSCFSYPCTNILRKQHFRTKILLQTDQRGTPPK